MRMRKGFTLIELLIVLAIIAALMAVVTPIALNAVKKAKASQVAENLRNIRTAVESYFYVEEEIPANLDTLVDAGYLNNVDTTNYTIDSTDLGSGKNVVEVVYSAGDIDPDFVGEIYSDANASGTNIYVRFYLQSWQ